MPMTSEQCKNRKPKENKYPGKHTFRLTESNENSILKGSVIFNSTTGEYLRLLLDIDPLVIKRNLEKLKKESDIVKRK
jgi:hypothetical protein